jgi:hypothetical protein
VCTANNNKNVYLLSGRSVTNLLTSGATAFANFTGGSCQNCGVAINQATNTAVIAMGLSSGSGSGIQFLNLANNAFSTPIPAANYVSEGLQWDPIRKLLLSPNESGVYDLFDTSSAPSAAPEFANSVTGELDSAASDCTTGIALAADEFTNNLYITDLTQATFTAGSPGTWTAPGQFVSIPEFSNLVISSAGTSGLAVAPGSHLAVVTGEFGGNQFGVFQLPASSGAGTPNFVDYAVANLPNTPDNQPWSEGLDPHPVTGYVSANNAKYAVLANSPPPTYLAAVDMQALLNAPRLVESHAVDQVGVTGCFQCIDLVATGIVRYVATKCGETGAPC